MSKTETIKPFKTDGCSGGFTAFYKKAFGKVSKIFPCCKDHDIPYWMGGTKEEKIASDKRLNKCVTKRTGSKILGWLAEKIVGGGGSPYLPLPWRWGYGYKYSPTRGFDKVARTAAEKKALLDTIKD